MIEITTQEIDRRNIRILFVSRDKNYLDDSASTVTLMTVACEMNYFNSISEHV